MIRKGTLVKICGVRDEATIDAAVAGGAEYIGIVHYQASPRHIDLKRAKALRGHARGSVKTVLLLVNADIAATGRAIEAVRPDVVQFHGTETPEWVGLVRDKGGVEVWKALGLKDAGTLERSERYADAVDRLLFDAPAKAMPGGTGTSFDWDLLANHQHQLPWALAGGLDPSNVAEAIRRTGAPLVDVSSGVESAPGVKDMDKIAQFCQTVRKAERAAT